MQIVRKKLSAIEFQSPGIRYNPGTDTVQTLVGGTGGTWVDTPAADPRTNPSALLPARTSSDPKCDAAANMTAKVKSIVDYYLATAEQALFVSGVLGIIAIFFPLVGLIAEVLWSIADVLVGLGTVVVGGAMTSGVYEHLTCYFYAQLDSSGQLDQAGLDAVLSAVSDGESSTVYDVIAAVFSGLGWVGIDNAGATGSEVGDCLACGRPVWEFYPDTAFSDNHRGTCSVGEWIGTSGGADNNRSTELIMRIHLATTTLTRVAFTLTKTIGTIEGASYFVPQDRMWADAAGGWTDGTSGFKETESASNTSGVWEWSGTQALTGILSTQLFAAAWAADHQGGTFGAITISHIEVDTADGNYVWDNC